MTPEQFLAQYAKGWTEGNVEVILGACAPDFVFLDPVASQSVVKGAFATHFQGIQTLVELKRQGVEGGPWAFMELSHVRVEETENGNLETWCWWEIPGTPIKGSGLIEVGPNGVRRETICYHLPPVLAA